MKKVFLALLLYFVCFSSYIFYVFARGEKRMKAFCGELRIGMSIDAISNKAAAHDYKIFTNDPNQPLLIVDSEAMGRFICEVHFEQGRASKVIFVYND